MANDKTSRTSGRRKLFVSIGIAVGLCLFVTVALMCCSRTEYQESNVLVKSSNDYAGFVEKWNQEAAGLPSRFQFIGSRGGEENIVPTLENWLAIFGSSPADAYRQELAAIKNDYGTTTFNAWEEFRENHYRSAPIEISTDMSPDRLIAAVNSYIGLGGQDHISRQTVSLVASMNDICVFFKQNRAELKSRGIDNNISTCEELATHGKYPALDAMLH